MASSPSLCKPFIVWLSLNDSIRWSSFKYLAKPSVYHAKYDRVFIWKPKTVLKIAYGNHGLCFQTAELSCQR